MKKSYVFALVLAFMMIVAAGCSSLNKKDGTAEPSGIVRGKAVVLTATVAAVDLNKRIVTLKDEEGNLRDFRIGKEAVNLPQVKVGDIVKIKFFESIAVEVTKPGKASGAGSATTIVRAKPGEMPGGMITRQTSVTATVKAVDKEAGTISLMGPNGKTVKVKVPEPENLEQVNVGDDLMITYTEAEAISVEHPK
jgi:hypothetical protein